MNLLEAANLCPRLRLHFTPKYGWGWKTPSDMQSLEYDLIDQQGTFTLDALAAFKFKDQYRGFSGIIIEPHHLLDGYTFVLWSMGDGIIDPDDGANHRWDLFFSHQPLREDQIDFPDSEEAGVGYGTPSLKRHIAAEPPS